MAQVNSEPGVSPVPPTVAVPAKTTDTVTAVAKAVAVPYAQSEPGRKADTAEGKRS